MNRELPKLVFFGTPDFAVPTLRRLGAEKGTVLLVVSQPDRPKGRGRKTSPSPVKAFAEGAGIPVFQPARVRDPEAVATIASTGAECAVVVAYGQILPRELLDLFPLGVLNIHGSVLPAYRGAAPIQRAILAGDRTTGVSIMLLDAGMDTGPVLSRETISIEESDTFGSLHDRLAEVGADLLVKTLPDWKRGRIVARPQDEGLATYAPPIGKEELKVDWTRPGLEVVNRIRAFDPWPGAHCRWEDRRVKCFKASLAALSSPGTPGEVLGETGAGLLVVAGDGRTVCIRELQLEGQRRLPAAEFLRGHFIPGGTILR